ncbi:MAG: response regulator transcription factor [Firmicutes bacterium]|nr:response regulator transcription factor [Bacillota bacterium]
MRKIMLVDDHEVVRVGLAALLRRRGDFEIVAEAAAAEEAVEKAVQTRPDVVIMDIRMPGGSGTEACRRIREVSPQSKVIMLTSFADDNAVIESIIAGASGYVLKEIGSDAIIDAIERVSRGESLLDPAVTEKVFAHMRNQASGKGGLQDTLTEQEKKILSLIGLGKTNREIAETIFLSEKTVRNYVSNIFAKLNLNNRAEAAAYAVRKGLVKG